MSKVNEGIPIKLGGDLGADSRAPSAPGSAGGRQAAADAAFNPGRAENNTQGSSLEAKPLRAEDIKGRLGQILAQGKADRQKTEEARHEGMDVDSLPFTYLGPDSSDIETKKKGDVRFSTFRDSEPATKKANEAIGRGGHKPVPYGDKGSIIVRDGDTTILTLPFTRTPSSLERGFDAKLSMTKIPGMNSDVVQKLGAESVTLKFNAIFSNAWAPVTLVQGGSLNLNTDAAQFELNDKKNWISAGVALEYIRGMMNYGWQYKTYAEFGGGKNLRAVAIKSISTSSKHLIAPNKTEKFRYLYPNDLKDVNHDRAGDPQTLEVKVELIEIEEFKPSTPFRARRKSGARRRRRRPSKSTRVDLGAAALAAGASVVLNAVGLGSAAPDAMRALSEVDTGLTISTSAAENLKDAKDTAEAYAKTTAETLNKLNSMTLNSKLGAKK